MTTLTYNQTDASSIEKFGQILRGSTLRKKSGVAEIPPEDQEATEGRKFKGKFGEIVERYYYGINPGNKACIPDFPEAGIELKTNSLIKKNGKWKAKERLALGVINYHDVVSETFEESCLIRKNGRMMLVSRRYVKDGVFIDSRIGFAQLICYDELPPNEQLQIRRDWETIVEMVRNGRAHELSSSQTKYLEASPKGKSSIKNRSQPFSEEMAQHRGFAIKQPYMTSLMTRYLEGNLQYLERDEEAALPDAADVQERGFEGAILNRFEDFLGHTVEEIESKVGSPSSRSAKGYLAALARAMLNVKTRKIAEFERANIYLKTILVHENGKPKEHISFPSFRYMGDGSILEEDWEAIDSLEDDDGEPEIDDTGIQRTPDIKRLLEEKRFLFVEYKKDGETARLNRVVFWFMPPNDIEEYVRPVWQQTVDSINTGKIDNFPKIRFNHVCHVRPHGTKKDVLPTPHNGLRIRSCFWLDWHYIQAQIAIHQSRD